MVLEAVVEKDCGSGDGGDCGGGDRVVVMMMVVIVAVLGLWW